MLLAAVILLAGCRGEGGGKAEYAFVANPDATLRDNVAAFYNKTGVVHNGERVQVLERMPKRRFVKVRTDRGEEGWIQERFLAGQRTYDQLRQLAEQFKDTPAQATAVARREVNLHVAPGRKTDHLYLLKENDKVEMIERQTADRNAPAPPATPQQNDKPGAETEPATGEEAGGGDKTGPAPVPEDWWLVRDSQKRVGWVLGRLLYVDVPIEIGQYAEGQRVVAFFVLDQAQAKNKDQSEPEYLVLLSENKDGLPFDYDQVRVFTWNPRRDRYETAFHEHGLEGVLPVTLGQEDFGKEGNLRTFTLRVKDASGAPRELKYKFKPPIVRRIIAPGDPPIPRAGRRAKPKRSHS